MLLLTVQVSAQLPGELLERLQTGVQKPPMLEKMLAGPMKDVEQIIFATAYQAEIIGTSPSVTTPVRKRNPKNSHGKKKTVSSGATETVPPW